MKEIRNTEDNDWEYKYGKTNGKQYFYNRNKILFDGFRVLRTA